MRAALALLLCLALPVQAIEPPDAAEIAEQERIVAHLLAKPNGRDDLPMQMSLWFGRTFSLSCDIEDGTCDLYVRAYDRDGHINYLKRIAVVPY